MGTESDNDNDTGDDFETKLLAALEVALPKVVQPQIEAALAGVTKKYNGELAALRKKLGGGSETQANVDGVPGGVKPNPGESAIKGLSASDVEAKVRDAMLLGDLKLKVGAERAKAIAEALGDEASIADQVQAFKIASLFSSETDKQDKQSGGGETPGLNKRSSRSGVSSTKSAAVTRPGSLEEWNALPKAEKLKVHDTYPDWDPWSPSSYR